MYSLKEQEIEYVIFHEITNGPFDRVDTIFAPWSPKDDDMAGQADYIKGLLRHVERLN